MKHNKIKALTAIMAMSAMSQEVFEPDTEVIIPKKEPKTEEEVNIKRGLKKFYFRDSYVWALNQKNADRKIKKLLK